MRRMTLGIAAALACWSVAATVTPAASAEDLQLDGWRPFSPRDEIRPDFGFVWFVR